MPPHGWDLGFATCISVAGSTFTHPKQGKQYTDLIRRKQKNTLQLLLLNLKLMSLLPFHDYSSSCLVIFCWCSQANSTHPPFFGCLKALFKNVLRFLSVNPASKQFLNHFWAKSSAIMAADGGNGSDQWTWLVLTVPIGNDYLVGGWTNPFEKVCSSNWIISPRFGVKMGKNIYETTT